MSKKTVIELISDRLLYLYKQLRKQEWDNPRVILITIAIVIFPFVAWYYISTGLMLGLLKAISILWIIEKAPLYIKELIVQYPLISDIALNLAMLMLIGGYFGAGLTLGLGAIFSMVFISWSLPAFAEKVKKERERNSNKQPEQDDTNENFATA
jgi:uncharacterized membrane protein